MNNVLIANIFGLLHLIISALSWHRKSKNKILGMQVVSNSCSYAQCLFLVDNGGTSGLFVKIIAILHDIININKENSKILRSKLIFIFFICIYLLIGIVTYKGLISILSIVAALIYTILMWKDNVKNVRYAAFISSIFWIMYNIGVNAYVSCISSCITFTSSLIAIVNMNKERENHEFNQ